MYRAVFLLVFVTGIFTAADGQAFAVLGYRDNAHSTALNSGVKLLDPIEYSLDEPLVQKSRKNRRVRASPVERWRDLFGLLQEERASPYGHTPLSSYTGEVSPFWSFRTNPNFVYSKKNEDQNTVPSSLEESWTYPPFSESTGSKQEDVMEAQGTELVEAEADPEPPKREEEFISEHEAPREVSTRSKYGLPGRWAKGEVPGKEDVNIGFVPVQIYSQTRRYDSEHHLPQEKAVEEAEDQEEILAAPRLREVLRNKKLHEVS